MLFILDKSHRVVGSLNSNGDLSRITTYFDDKYVQDLGTGAETFTFTTMANTEQSQYLVAGNFIAFKDDGEFKLFNIIQIEESHEDVFTKTVYCEMAGIELINEIIRPMDVLNSSLQKFLNTILAGTEWQLGKIDISFTQVYDFNISDYKSVYELIQEYAVGTFGAEISYRVEIENGIITGKYIDCYAQRGNENGFRFAYGSNLTSVVKTVDMSNLATALIGVGKNGTTFKSVETGDKPLNQDFITNEVAYEQWNINGSHIFGVHKEDTESPQELLRLTRLALIERANPQIKYEMKVELLGKEVKIGDTVNIVDHEFNPPLYLSARVNQLTRSKTDPQSDEVVLANFREVKSNISDEMRQLASQLEGYIDGVFPIGNDKIQDGAINGDKLHNGQIITGTHLFANSVTADKISAGSINTNHLQADCITADKIQANAIDADKIQADSITSNHIQAGAITSGHIGSGTITTNHIQAGTITSGSGIIGEGAIGDAQISNLDAGKITAGTIDTSKVNVQGADGHLRIRGNRMQVFDGLGDTAIERVSVGDVNGDGSVFGFRVRGADGKTVLYDENGVTSEGITDGSINNDKISDDANIDGAKININSVVSKINEDGTEVIKGTKIEVDGTNLETKLSTITNKQDENSEKITQAYSQILANENAIKLKVDEQTYTSDKEDMTDKLDKATSEIDVLKESIALKIDKTEIENVKNELGETIDTKIVDVKAELKIETDNITQHIENNYYNKDDINSKGYQTSSDVQQTVNALEVKFSESGGYNLLYNGDFKNKTESWTQDVINGFGWTDGLSCKNGMGVYSRGELNYTKALRQNYLVLDPNVNSYTLSFWQYTSFDGADGTTNPFRSIEIAIGYSDGSWSYHSTGNQSNANIWEKKIIRITKPENKSFKYANVGLWCRDTTNMVYFSQIMLEKGAIANEWSPNPNETFDGITKITKDGIVVSNTNSDTRTVMDSTSFTVESTSGATIAEFSKDSIIPNLTAGIINASEVYANNVASKSAKNGDIKFLYVNGSTGNDSNNGSQSYPLKTVQKAIEQISDVQHQSVTIYVYNSVPGFELKGVTGVGKITISLQDSAIVNGRVLIGSVTNRVAITNESGSRKATFKAGIAIYGCVNVDIYGLAFRGLASEQCNIYVRDTNYCAINSCDLGGLSTTLLCAIKVQSSLVWLFGCIGSNITDVVGQYAFSHVMMARGGTSNVPDYTSGLLVNYDGSGRMQNWSGGTFTKTPSSGWNPSYTPTQKTTTWSFNKVWSDETLNGWSDKQELIQGYASTWSTGRYTGYMQFTDNMSAIRTAISGGTNLSGRIYVQRRTTSGNSTGSKLCLYASDGTVITTSTTIDRGQGVWVSLSSSIISKIASGAITYFYLKADTNNTATYFKCESNPKIEITYTN